MKGCEVWKQYDFLLKFIELVLTSWALLYLHDQHSSLYLMNSECLPGIVGFFYTSGWVLVVMIVCYILEDKRKGDIIFIIIFCVFSLIYAILLIIGAGNRGRDREVVVVQQPVVVVAPAKVEPNPDAPPAEPAKLRRHGYDDRYDDRYGYGYGHGHGRYYGHGNGGVHFFIIIDCLLLFAAYLIHAILRFKKK